MSGSRKFCPGCKYPMLALSRFGGTSSRDAPLLPARGDTSYWNREFLRLAFLPLFLIGLKWREKKQLKRRQEVARIRARVLPHDPEAQICPLCFHVEHSYTQL